VRDVRDYRIRFSRSPGSSAVQGIVLELKLLHGSLEATLAEGIAQTRAYMDRCGAQEGHFLILDRHPGRK